MQLGQLRMIKLFSILNRGLNSHFYKLNNKFLKFLTDFTHHLGQELNNLKRQSKGKV